METGNLSGAYLVLDENDRPVNVSSAGVETGSFFPGSLSPPDSQANKALKTASFQVSPTPLGASFDSNVVAQNTTTLQLNRSEGGYNLTVAAGELAAETILGIFDGRGDAFVNENDEVEFPVSNEQPGIDANFSSVSVGPHEFTFGVNGTAETARAAIRVTPTSDASPTFLNRTVEVTRGGIARIPIRTELATRMRVHVGFGGSNYNGTFLVESGTEDDVATLELNTYTLGRYGNRTGDGLSGTAIDAAQTASSDDEVLAGWLNQSEPLTSAPEPSTYELNVTVGGEQTDVGFLRVQPHTETAVWTRALPERELEEYETVSDIRAEFASERDREVIASGDVLVIGIDESGLSGVLATQEDADRSLLGHNGSTFALTVEQQNPRANRQTKVLDLGETVREGKLEILPDAESETVYLLARTDDLVFRGGTTGSRDAVAAGNQFRVELELLEDGSLVTRDRTFETAFMTVEPSVGFGSQNATVAVRAQADQSISGTTTVAPGTELEVRARNSGDEPFLKEATVDVGPERTFDAVFDFADVAVNTTFQLNAVGIPDANASGLVSEPLRAMVSFDSQRVENNTVNVTAVNFSHGGYLALRNDSATGSVVGISRTLSPGRHTNVTVPTSRQWNGSKTIVAVPYYNRTDGDRTIVRRSDVAYQRGGSVTSDAATVTRPTVQSGLDENGTDGQGTGERATNGGGTPPTADELQTPINNPPAPSDELAPTTAAAESAGPGLAALSVVVYGVIALGMLITFVVVRD